MIRWILIGTALQTAMVVLGHWVPQVALLFAPLGMAISLVVGLLWARQEARGSADAARGGAFVGGSCALVGITISFLLGDVGPIILLAGTASSAVTGMLGGLAGGKLRKPAAAGAT